jgi:ATP-dependent protease HslVU (ClpYQ) peptidase subunit
MTTIAYKHGILVADRMVTQAGMKSGNVCKITSRANDQHARAGGCAGTLTDMTKFSTFIENNNFDKFRQQFIHQPEASPDRANGDCPNGFIVVRQPDRQDLIFVWDGDDVIAPMCPDFDFIAVGTGARFAMGAMAHGASAEEAVKIAAMLDTLTGDERDVIEIKRRAAPDAAEPKAGPMTDDKAFGEVEAETFASERHETAADLKSENKALDKWMSNHD